MSTTKDVCQLCQERDWVERIHPLIGSLMDEYELLPGDVKSDPELKGLMDELEAIMQIAADDDTDKCMDCDLV